MSQANKELASETYNKKAEFEEKKAKVVDLSIKAAELKEAYNGKYGNLSKLEHRFCWWLCGIVLHCLEKVDGENSF